MRYSSSTGLLFICLLITTSPHAFAQTQPGCTKSVEEQIDEIGRLRTRYTDSHPDIVAAKKCLPKSAQQMLDFGTADGWPSLILDLHVFHADNPARSFVVIDGRRLSAGGALSDEIVLQTINNVGAIFRRADGSTKYVPASVFEETGPAVSRQAPAPTQLTYGKVPWGKDTYEGPLKNGVPHGVGTVTYAYGTFEGQFVDGKREGAFRYTEDGVLAAVETYRNGVRHGPAVSFATRTKMSSSYTAGAIGYQVGDKKFQGNYSNGKPDGDHYTYRRANGALRAISKVTYSNGTIVSQHDDFTGSDGNDLVGVVLDTWKQVEQMKSVAAGSAQSRVSAPSSAVDRSQNAENPQPAGRDREIAGVQSQSSQNEAPPGFRTAPPAQRAASDTPQAQSPRVQEPPKKASFVHSDGYQSDGSGGLVYNVYVENTGEVALTCDTRVSGTVWSATGGGNLQNNYSDRRTAVVYPGQKQVVAGLTRVVAKSGRYEVSCQH
jgi:hypothetical protein